MGSSSPAVTNRPFSKICVLVVGGGDCCFENCELGTEIVGEVGG